jgi:CheY-like chemotaxis protein
VEAGKIVVRPVDFEVDHIFGVLRGMLRPLLLNESVALVFDAADDLPPLHTDEAKVSQILRNFISNALKFTERGEVRVSARPTADRASIAFSVSDTGIGIAAEDHQRIFEEFAQVDSPIQRRVKGTGLGLPLCRKLAELLHGSVTVESAPGIGSTFTALIPIRYEDVMLGRFLWNPDPSRIPILVIEDSAETLLVYERMLTGGGFQLLAARSLREARAVLAEMRPRGIVLDIMLQGEDSWSFLTDLKRHPHTQNIPIAVITSVDDAAKGIALGADAYCVKPLDRQRLVQTITQLVAPETVKRILLIDDQEVSRYVLRQNIAGPCHLISEAKSGMDGIRTACAELPDLICLDLGMPDLEGGEVLRQLKADPATSAIPVVIVTARDLEAADRDALLRDAASIVAKDKITRDRMTEVLQAALDTAGGGA